MSGIYSWIYIDGTSNIWKFFQDDNKELKYSVMYEEGKWTKESLITKDVLEFIVCIDESETIHIVYINAMKDLMYCTLRDGIWVGKKLYELENDNIEIRDLKAEILRNEMLIFFLQINNKASNEGVLMNYIWKGEEREVIPVQNIVLKYDAYRYYWVNANDENSVNIFFMTDEGDEISFYNCRLENYMWSSGKRMYGIQGDEIDFEVTMHNEEIHIVNKYREDSTYFLEHVFVDKNGSIEVLRIHESKNKITELMLFIEGNKLYLSWLEKGEIMYSHFDFQKWSRPICFYNDNEQVIKKYNYIAYNGNLSTIKLRQVYGNDKIDLRLFLPSCQSVMDPKKTNKHEEIRANLDETGEERVREDIRLTLTQLKSEKKNSERKIAYLNMQLQSKERLIEEYEERITRILDQKRKAEENCNIFLELQQNIQKELNNVKQQLVEENKINENMKNKLKAFEEEKSKLYEELKLEKNKSIMERLLGRKSSEL